MVDLLGRSDSAVLLALLTQRMRRNITVPDAFPCSSVPLSLSRVAPVLFIAFVLFALMLHTVTPVCQVGTAGVGTRPIGSLRHRITSSQGIKKALRDYSHKAHLHSAFLIIILS